MVSTMNCKFCGKRYDDQPIYHDTPYNHLGEEGMYCWKCYHEQVIKQDKPAFGNAEIGHNAGWTGRDTLAAMIEEAMVDADDNIDMGIAINAPIAGSYTASVIIRNGGLYVRFADLYPLMEADTVEERRALIQQIVNQINWSVLRPIPKSTPEGE